MFFTWSTCTDYGTCGCKLFELEEARGKEGWSPKFEPFYRVY